MFKMKSRRSLSASLDFSSIPIEKTIHMLREVGESLLVDLLEGEGLPTLSETLSHDQMRLLILPNRRSVSRKRMRRTPTSLPAMLMRAQRQLSYRRQLAIPLLDNVEHQLEGISPSHIPPTFWALVAARAWGSLEFRHRIAEIATTHLRTRILMLPGEFPVPLLATNTFWLLIALAGALPKRRFPLNLTQGREQRALQRWQKEAESFAKERLWAGFWDQWILLEALRSQPVGLTRLDPALRQALMQLPLRQFHRAMTDIPEDTPESEEKKGVKLSLATPTWMDNIELYWKDNLAHWLELAMLP